MMITPETRIGTLLDNYPQLEEVLIKAAPPFAKLRNPVLRKTIARVTTLRQAALVGGISLAELINTLRRAAGETGMDTVFEDTPALNGNPPVWLKKERVVQSFDARPMIQNGEQPLGPVMRQLNNLEPGEILELITPFVPAPLIDKARQKGFDIWYMEEKPHLFKTYFGRP